MALNPYFGQEIFTPNFTSRNEMQTMWSYTTTACGRPAADYGVSIICRPLSEPTGGRYQPYIVDEGTDFMTFAKCCPRDNGLNQYINQRDCSHYCYTDDMKLAGAFSRCINDTAKVAIEAAHKAGKLNDTSRPGQYWGRCEYIDYKRLKQGIRDSGASQHHDGIIKSLISAVSRAVPRRKWSCLRLVVIQLRDRDENQVIS